MAKKINPIILSKDGSSNPVFLWILFSIFFLSPLFAYASAKYTTQTTWKHIPLENLGGIPTMNFLHNKDSKFTATIQTTTLNQANLPCKKILGIRNNIKSKRKKTVTSREASIGPYFCQITEQLNNKTIHIFYSKNHRTVQFEIPLHKGEIANGVRNYEVEMRRFILEIATQI